MDEAEQRANGVTMRRADGTGVDGLRYGSGTTGVVFANQVDGDLCQWQSNAQAIAGQGYQAVVFNYSTSPDAQNDVLAAVATLRSGGATKVFLVGASMGGTAVLAAAGAAQPPVSGVVSLSAPQSFSGINAWSEMAKFTTPVLFIAGEYDEPFAGDARELYKVCAVKDKRLVMRESGRHGVALVDAEVTSMIMEFLRAH